MIRRCSVIVIALLCTACAAVGPDYERPVVEIPRNWQMNIQEANNLANMRWWEQFNDPILNELIGIALQENLDIKIAAARVEQYLGLYGATRSAQFPQLGLNADAARTRSSENSSAGALKNPINSYQLGLGATFELDFWGKLRRATESARADLLATDEARRMVIMSLVSQLAAEYVQLLGYDQQLIITRATLKTRKESMRINGLRFKAGLIGEMDYQQAVAEYQSAAVQVPLLEKQIAQQENAISLLLGRNPGQIKRGKTLNTLAALPIPSGLPSDLLERRPDIRQAEQQLIAANAQIGVAKAAFFPSISLTGLLGVASSDLSDLFRGPSRTWQFAGALTQPIFTAGQLSGNLQAAEALQQQALFNYQQTIQNAFAEVDNGLIDVAKLRDQLQDQGLQAKALQRTVDLANLRYQNGYSDYLTVVDAERNLFSVQLEYAQNQGNLLIALVNLYKTLGGGWIDQAEQLAVNVVTPTPK